MKERPIIFSAPMVRAILAGNKTMTRRVCKGARDLSRAADWQLDLCPYGQPGDRLWVRETWRTTVTDDVTEARRITEDITSGTAVDYRATFVEDFMREGPVSRADAEECCGFERWRPSIFMPRWASRIALVVTGVRVERLQDITSAQILAEGVRIPTDAATGNVLIDISTPNGPGHFLKREQYGDADALLFAHFAALWVAINGIDSWHANPWIWVVEFKRADQAKAA